ncbi:MAG: cohesin domain-containing protein [Clostridiaceae bacterium]
MVKGKKLLVWVMGLLMIFSSGTYASEETIVSSGGAVHLKAGESFNIPISLENVERLYAGSIDITYDNKLVSFKKISPGSIITGSDYNKFEVGGTPNDKDSKISYDFTFVGKTDGFTGDGELLILSGQANQDTVLNFKENTSIKLMSRTTDDKIQEIKFSYYTKPVDDPVSEPSVSEGKNIPQIKGEGSGGTVSEKKNSETAEEKTLVKDSYSGAPLEADEGSGTAENERISGNVKIKQITGLAVIALIGLFVLYFKRKRNTSV